MCVRVCVCVCVCESVAVSVPRGGARAAQVWRTRVQHPVRVHRRRPSHLHQPAEDVPRGVHRDPVQGRHYHAADNLYSPVSVIRTGSREKENKS